MTSTKTALVTGASGNLGKALTDKLISDGFSVLGTVLSKEDYNRNPQNEALEYYEADVTNEGEVERLVGYLSDKYGQINFAALTVGGFAMGELKDTSLEDVQKMLKLNFETAYLCSQHLYKQMAKQDSGGHIVLVGARPALDSSAAASMVSYSLSKSLLFQLSDIINAKTSETGVRSSIIVPSVIDTPPNRESMPDANFDDWVTPEQIAETVSFLASPSSRPLRQTVFKLYGNA